MADRIADPAVQAAFDAFPDPQRKALLTLRARIFDEAAAMGAGPVVEKLSWGEPAYRARHGATLRLGLPKSGGFALYVTCTTSLMDDFRAAVGETFRYEGNRAVLFDAPAQAEGEALGLLIRAAHRYHLR
ncbi:MAG: DUF1801 domain-containing protein [Maritimibacter sp.]